MRVSLMLTLASLAACEDDPGQLHSSPKLKVITQDMFESQVVNPKTNAVQNGVWMIKFFAPWCGHCKRLAPAWDDFASQHGDAINVAVIDCDQNELSGICTMFDVGGYPTILMLKDRHFYKYKGERTVEAFKAFVDEGYLQAEKEPMPRKLEGFDLYMKQFQKFSN